MQIVILIKTFTLHERIKMVFLKLPDLYRQLLLIRCVLLTLLIVLIV